MKLITEGLHSELAGTNVRVTVVFPGAVARTSRRTRASTSRRCAPRRSSTRKVLPADKAARIILDGMEKDAYRVMVGSDAKLMDRLYRHEPARAAGFIAKQMKDLLAT